MSPSDASPPPPQAYPPESTTNGKPPSASDNPAPQASSDGRRHGKRDTHFICFPLVTDASIPQLAASLRQFRELSSITPEITRRRMRTDRGIQQRSRQDTPEKGSRGDDAGVGGSVEERGRGWEEGGEEEEDDDDLKILPPSAHRPPGTFHLTIGTMDLSEKEEMGRAVRVLKGLDVRGMLREVEREVGFVAGAEVERGTDGDAEGGGGDGQGASAMGKAEEGADGQIQSLTTPSISPPSALRSRPWSSTAPLIISLEGLGAFQSARRARVFYALPHDPSNRLLRLANKIRAVFKAEGLVTEKRELTLHATVVNMRYADKRKNGGRMEGVDGRGLVAVFGGRIDRSRGWVVEDEGGNGLQGRAKGQVRENGYVWARDVVVDRVRICKMGAEKSEDEVLGMVYPAVMTGDGGIAEVGFA